MKKKIINGILMVALLAATTTSFVSCKDNDEDVKTDLIAQLNKKAGDLDAAYKQADADLNTAIQAQLANKADKQDLDDFKQKVADEYVTKTELATTLADYATKDYVDAETKKLWDALNDPDDPNSVVNQLADLNDELADQAEDIEDIQEDIDEINETLEDLQEQIDELKEAFENLITSVAVNATSTNILENSLLFPGLNIQFLGAIYGEAIKDVKFPDIAGVEPEFTAEQGDILFNKERGAGKVYFTVNPSNIDESKIANVTLSLINSNNDASLITLNKAKASDKTLAWGTRADADVILWEADATADPDKLGKLAPAEIIDLKQIGEHVKAMVKEAKAAAQDVNRSNYSSTAKTTTKEILKETAALLADLAQTKLPALPALAMKAQWEDFVGTRAVISDYSIAATGYKPVDFYWGQGIINEGSSISFDKIDNLAARVINKVKAQLNKFNLGGLKINSITLTDAEKAKFDKTQTIYIWIKKTSAAGYVTDVDIAITTTNECPDGYTAASDKAIDADMREALDDLLESVNKSLKDANDAIADVVNQVQGTINTANKYADKTLSLEKRVSNYLESYLNRIIGSISANGLYKVLQPILLYEGPNGVNRIVSGSTFKAGETITLLPTTVTNELLAPACKKYISVNGEGKVLTNGDDDFKKYEITLKKGENTIVYAALDFYGNQVVKNYTVYAE